MASRTASDHRSGVPLSVQRRMLLPAPMAHDHVWQRFTIEYRFPVIFTRGLFESDNRRFASVFATASTARPARLIVFVDGELARARPELPERITAYCRRHATLDLTIAPIVIEGGERIKRNWRALAPMQRTLADVGLDRHGYVVAVGGGALLDAAGLVAATAHRGIRHVRVPTTVLAQNDSGVGVKNAVNQFGQKNYLGTFAPPDAVLNDLDLLATLPMRERRDGLAEVVKVALIRDGGFFLQLEQDIDRLATLSLDALEGPIRRCAELHMQQIGQGGDPFERGSARPLDFGHWSAHRLESMSDYRLSHGEAVAIGIAIDTCYSSEIGRLPARDAERVLDLLERLGFSLWDELLDRGRASLLPGLEQFRAHLGGELTITLLDALGVGVEVHEMDATIIDRVLKTLRVRHRRRPAAAE